MRLSASSSKVKGMTLLEVLLALVILAMSGLAAMQAATGALVNQSYLQDKTIALWVASNQIAELKLQKQWPSERWVTDSTEFAGNTWHYRYQTVATGDSNFKALDMEVSDQKEGKPYAYIRTYIARQ
ncbi:MAG: type II secretion system minor pseudopilin GspI [Psychromonas sp.]